MKTSIVLCFLSIFLLQSVFGQDTGTKVHFPFYPLFDSNVKVNISYLITDVNTRQIGQNDDRKLIEQKKTIIKKEK